MCFYMCVFQVSMYMSEISVCLLCSCGVLQAMPTATFMRFSQNKSNYISSALLRWKKTYLFCVRDRHFIPPLWWDFLKLLHLLLHIFFIIIIFIWLMSFQISVTFCQAKILCLVNTVLTEN